MHGMRGFKHANTRLKERYNLETSQRELGDLVKKIQNNKGFCVSKKSNTTGEWLIYFKGRLVRTVYNNKYKYIVTFLPIHGRHYEMYREMSDKYGYVE